MALVPSMATRMAIARSSNQFHVHANRAEGRLTQEEPEEEAGNNHNNSKCAGDCQRQSQSHVPENNAELLVG